MRKVILLVVGVVATSVVSAQDEPMQSKVSARAAQVYAEFLGPGIVFSANYDTRFQKSEKGIGFRIGAGGTLPKTRYISDGTTTHKKLLFNFSVPFQLNYLIGNKGKYLELGAGATYTTEPLDLSWTRDVDPDSHFFGSVIIGFRLQPFKKKGLTCRIHASPIIGAGAGMFPWAGTSLGYRF